MKRCTYAGMTVPPGTQRHYYAGNTFCICPGCNQLMRIRPSAPGDVFIHHNAGPKR